MSTHQASFLAVAIMLSGAASAGTRSVEQHQPAGPHGSVEINNVAGRIEVSGWDQEEVSLSGTLDDDVERLELSGGGDHTMIKVIYRSGHFGWGASDGAHLKIKVPRGSALSATLVSSSIKVAELTGDLKVQTVSGGIDGKAGADVRLGTVSGTIHLEARAAKHVELSSVSGNVSLHGGDGEVNVSTVSGDATIDVGTIMRAHFKSVSGDLKVTLGLDPDARIEAESVSGDLRLDLRGTHAADFDAQSMSGEIENCFGPKAVQPEYGPGSRLQFKDGTGGARVRLGTQSGDIRLCTSAQTS